MSADDSSSDLARAASPAPSPSSRALSSDFDREPSASTLEAPRALPDPVAAAPASEPHEHAIPRSARTRPPLEDLFRNPHLTRLTDAIMRSKRIPDQEREDLRQDILTALYVWSRRQKHLGAADLKRGARSISKRIAARFWRRVMREGKRSVGLVGDTEEFGPLPTGPRVDLIDLKKLVAEVDELVATGELSEKSAAILVALSEDVTLADHANETGQSPTAVRKALERARRKVVARIADRGLIDVGLEALLKAGTAVAVAVAIILLLVYTGHFGGVINPPVAHNTQNPPLVPTAVELPAPPPPTIEEMANALAPPVDNREKAAQTLMRAELAYKDYNWGDCARRVSEAKKLDRAAGDAPELRDACLNEAQLDAEAKAPRRPPRKK